MSPSKSITGVLIRTVRPSSSVKVTGVMSLVGQTMPIAGLFSIGRVGADRMVHPQKIRNRPFLFHRHSRPLAAQPRAEAHRILAEELSSSALGETRAIGRLLDAFRPRRVAVRPIGREQPEVLTQFLDAE